MHELMNDAIVTAFHQPILVSLSDQIERILSCQSDEIMRSQRVTDTKLRFRGFDV